MTPRFEAAAIIGVGLLGGSLGLALKQRGLAGEVRGVGRRQSTLDTALEMGLIDRAYLDPLEAVRGAALVVVCTPAAQVLPMLDLLEPACARSAIVTDVASTKAMICRHAATTWPKPLRFVGSHPMAGSEKFGPAHSDPDLYSDRFTIVCPSPGTDRHIYTTVVALWKAVGAKVVELSAELHDALVARTSHVPHVVAACLAELARAEGPVHTVAGSGFRDMTRVADGRAELWSEICLTNREAIAAGLDTLAQRLGWVREQVLAGNQDALLEFFENARAARREALGE